MGFGSGEGSSPADPPFAQLGGETSGGWKDRFSALGAGLVNAGDDDFKKGLTGAGDMRAFQKRRDANKFRQQSGLGSADRQALRDKANARVQEYEGGGS